MAEKPRDTGRTGRLIALVIAGTGIFYVIFGLIASEYGWSNRTRALFDLIALAGFGVALVMAIGLWRARKSDDDRA